MENNSNQNNEQDEAIKQFGITLDNFVDGKLKRQIKEIENGTAIVIAKKTLSWTIIIGAIIGVSIPLIFFSFWVGNTIGSNSSENEKAIMKNKIEQLEERVRILRDSVAHVTGPA